MNEKIDTVLLCKDFINDKARKLPTLIFVVATVSFSTVVFPSLR